jgi:hypothetical protein
MIGCEQPVSFWVHVPDTDERTLYRFQLLFWDPVVYFVPLVQQRVWLHHCKHHGTIEILFLNFIRKLTKRKQFETL